MPNCLCTILLQYLLVVLRCRTNNMHLASTKTQQLAVFLPAPLSSPVGVLLVVYHFKLFFPLSIYPCTRFPFSNFLLYRQITFITRAVSWPKEAIDQIRVLQASTTLDLDWPIRSNSSVLVLNDSLMGQLDVDSSLCFSMPIPSNKLLKFTR